MNAMETAVEKQMELAGLKMILCPHCAGKSAYTSKMADGRCGACGNRGFIFIHQGRA